MKKRIEYIDLLKAFAIFSVIAIHINAITRDYYIVNNKVYYVLFTLLDSLTRAGVPLFFMITGILVLGGRIEEDYKKFIKRKLPKLVIPFLFFSFIYYFYALWDLKTSFHVLDFIQKFTNNNIMYHFWYMYIIIILYLFIPYEKVWIEKLKQRDLKRLIITVFVFGNVLSTVYLISARYGYPIFESWKLPKLIIYHNYMLLGYYVHQYELKHKNYIYLLGIFSLLWMPIFDFYYVQNVRNDSLLIATSILPLFYTISIYYLIKNFYYKIIWHDKLKRWIEKISDLSIYIYLSHVLVMNIIVKILNQCWRCDRLYENILFTVVVFLLTSILSFGVAIASDYAYRKLEQLWKK